MQGGCPQESWELAGQAESLTLFLTPGSSLGCAGQPLVLLLAEQQKALLIFTHTHTHTISGLFLGFSRWVLATDSLKRLEQVVCFPCPEEEE